jgi:hypothetical protein
MVSAFLLIFGLFTKAAAFLSAILLVSFLLAVGLNLARGRDIECGCFGHRSQRRLDTAVLVEDVFLLILALGIFLLDRGHFSAGSLIFGHRIDVVAPSTSDIVPALLVYGICLALFSLLRQGVVTFGLGRKGV